MTINSSWVNQFNSDPVPCLYVCTELRSQKIPELVLYGGMLYYGDNNNVEIVGNEQKISTLRTKLATDSYILYGK